MATQRKAQHIEVQLHAGKAAFAVQGLADLSKGLLFCLLATSLPHLLKGLIVEVLQATRAFCQGATQAPACFTHRAGPKNFLHPCCDRSFAGARMGAQKAPQLSLFFHGKLLQTVKRGRLGDWPVAFAGIAVLAAAAAASLSAVLAVADNERVPLRIVHRHAAAADGIQLLRTDELDGAEKSHKCEAVACMTQFQSRFCEHGIMMCKT